MNKEAPLSPLLRALLHASSHDEDLVLRYIPQEHQEVHDELRAVHCIWKDLIQEEEQGAKISSDQLVNLLNRVLRSRKNPQTYPGAVFTKLSTDLKKGFLPPNSCDRCLKYFHRLKLRWDVKQLSRTLKQLDDVSLANINKYEKSITRISDKEKSFMIRLIDRIREDIELMTEQKTKIDNEDRFTLQKAMEKISKQKLATDLESWTKRKNNERKNVKEFVLTKQKQLKANTKTRSSEKFPVEELSKVMKPSRRKSHSNVVSEDEQHSESIRIDEEFELASVMSSESIATSRESLEVPARQSSSNKDQQPRQPPKTHTEETHQQISSNQEEPHPNSLNVGCDEKDPENVSMHSSQNETSSEHESNHHESSSDEQNIQRSIMLRAQHFFGFCADFNSPQGCNRGDACDHAHESVPSELLQTLYSSSNRPSQPSAAPGPMVGPAYRSSDQTNVTPPQVSIPASVVHPNSDFKYLFDMMNYQQQMIAHQQEENMALRHAMIQLQHRVYVLEQMMQDGSAQKEQQ